MNIVCFGDSNTWGLCCEPYRRFTREERWPALLQRRFGDRAYVIEEGLNGRTANELDEEEPFLNGRSYATACMLTHRPVDVLIIMLGSNDVKVRYKKDAEQISESIYKLAFDMKATLDQSQEERVRLLLIAPKSIDARVFGDGSFDENSIDKSEKIPAILESYARQEEWLFIDANKQGVTLGRDGLHLSKEGHECLCESIYNVIND